MGADLIVAVLGMPLGKEPDWVAAEAHIRGRAWVGDEELRQTGYLDEWCEVCAQGGAKGEPRSLHAAANECPAVALLLKDLAELKEAWAGGRRDAAVVERKTEALLITGDMSWGELPEGTFTTVEHLRLAGALDAAGFE